MSWLTDIFAGGASGLFSGIADIIGKFKADPTIMAQNAQKVLELEAAAQQAQMQFEFQMSQAQTKINEIEAASGDKYVSRWRPTVGWICCGGLVYSVLGFPLLTWASINFGWKAPPELDTSVLTAMLGGLLGIGTMRSFDKLKGTSK